MSKKYIISGVMGWPVAHSRSPLIHNHWIQQYQLNGAYGLFPVPPEKLHEAILGIKALGLAGCNVTIPHKVTAMQHMDWVDPLAQQMGAINTVVLQPNGELHGFNTDGIGYIQSLKDEDANWQADERPIVVIGAGGAARGIVLSLIHAGASHIRLVNRTNANALAMADEFGPAVTAVAWSQRHECLSDASLLINTTNQGMDGQAALDLDLAQLPESALVSDAIYIPLETPLLQQARARGNTTINGLGMLLNQARPGFEAWFGVTPEITPSLKQKLIDSI
jgi:shikimate dehydrogenase